jgi:excisionase family DNA binding protein
MAKYDYLGTVRIARLLQVSPRTVANWIDAGLMGGEKLPSGRRRVHRDAVVQFAQERGMTLHPDGGSGCAAGPDSLSS